MYLYFLKKNKGDLQPFPTTAAVNQYLCGVGQNDTVYVLPGYMSRSQSSVSTFCNGIQFQNNKVFLGYGMNGSVLLKGTTNPSGITIIDEHIQDLKGKPNVSANPIVRTKGNKDHSKCMFFLKSPQSTTEKVIEAMDEWKLKVRAALIGSSNWSDTTYFKPKAEKGEFDVLLVADDTFDINVSVADTKAIQFYTELSAKVNQNGDTNGNKRIALFKEMTVSFTLEDLLRDLFGTQTGF